MKILVTGGAGFIGSSLADYLIRKTDAYVVIVDNYLTGRQNNLPQSDRCKFIKANANDFNDISSVFHGFGFDYVFHYAAVVGVKRTLENPVMVLDDLMGIRNILTLSKNTGVKRVFYASSSEVYGEPVHLPQHEHTTPLNSRLPYAVVKNAGEAFCRSYYQEYGLEYTLFRFFNTYGPKQSHDFVVSRFIDAALLGKPITIYGDGQQTRTFCYVEDNLEATTNCLLENKFINDVVNIGNDLEISVLDLAEVIRKLTNSKSKIIHLDPLPEGDMTRRQPDIEKMQCLLNRPFISLEEGLVKVIEVRKARLETLIEQ
ncbi:MAG: NAD-dependent epimerase/dehydratase family protein [Chitinophagaceae bacterium]|nr:NAD-dependent epimerase/dehydratase family protein [Chitinophagaceae bacterium]